MNPIRMLTNQNRLWHNALKIILEDPFPMSNSNITHLWRRYQIKINLEGMKPPVWRRLIVDSRIPLNALHDAIQMSMGWLDMHLHHFVDREDLLYGEIDPEFQSFDEMINEESVILSDLLKKEKDYLHYDYDFGDDWRHKIILEKILPADHDSFPIICVKGMRACPPEDVGGVWGYRHMLEVLDDPTHEEYEEMKEWIGDYFHGPDYFDLDAVNEAIQDVFNGVKFSSKPNKATKKIANINPARSLISDLDGEIELEEAIFNDPEIPDEIKEFTSQLLETLDIVKEMSDMLDENHQAFQEILSVSKEAKVKKIAKQMLRNME